MSDGKNPCYCAAHGCPMLGTMATSTTGATEWWCYMHFGKDVGSIQALTVEINRREWLAKIVTDIRMTYGTEKWGDTFRVAQHELSMHQRNDLHFGKAEKETAVWKWLRRLENELEAMCKGSFTKPPKQVRIDIKEPLQRVQFDVPEPA